MVGEQERGPVAGVTEERQFLMLTRSGKSSRVQAAQVGRETRSSHELGSGGIGVSVDGDAAITVDYQQEQAWGRGIVAGATSPRN